VITIRAYTAVLGNGQRLTQNRYIQILQGFECTTSVALSVNEDKIIYLSLVNVEPIETFWEIKHNV